MLHKTIYVIVFSLFGHYYLYSQNEIRNLKQFISIIEQKDKINTDQVNDLMFSLQQLKLEQESIKSVGYVAGIVDSLSEKNHYSAIWHDGYNKGSETEKSIVRFTQK